MDTSRSKQDHVESILLEQIEELLNLPEISLENDFFELGGDSIIALELAAKLEEALGVAVDLRQIFQADSIGELAQQLAASL